MANLKKEQLQDVIYALNISIQNLNKIRDQSNKEVIDSVQEDLLTQISLIKDTYESMS